MNAVIGTLAELASQQVTPPRPHPATVTAIATDTAGVNVMVRLDGSTDDLPAQNITGHWLRADQRVMCLLTPPHLILIIGVQGSYQPPYFRLADTLDLAQNTATTVQWTAIEEDTEGTQAVPATTFRVPFAGLWLMTAWLRSDDTAGTRALMDIRVDGLNGELRSVWSQEVAGVVTALRELTPTNVLDVQLFANTFAASPASVDVKVNATWLGRAP